MLHEDSIKIFDERGHGFLGSPEINGTRRSGSIISYQIQLENISNMVCS